MKAMYTLPELAAELRRQATAKADYVADTQRMHFVTGETGSQLDLIGSGSDETTAGFTCNDVFHQQVGRYCHIPRAFYVRLQEHAELWPLLDHNVNRLLRHEPKKRMVRTLDGVARALVSDAYRRLDNDAVARTVLPILGEIPDVRFESCAVTDTHMYIKAVTPRVKGEVKLGEEVCAGVVIRNSEVGWGALKVEPMVFTLACTNGMIVGRKGIGMMERVHVGRRVQADADFRVFSEETQRKDDEAFMSALGDVVRAAVDEVRFRDLVREMAQTARSKPVEDPIAAVELLAKNENLQDGEARDVLRHLASGGDLTRWGVLSAVTRASQDVESYDRATELEELGGKILTYGPAQWRTLQEVTA